MVSTPPPAKYAPGMFIGGKYRLERKLGEGGMGSVWAAHHEQLDTAVAIKVIRSGVDERELGLRLLQEARAAAKLGHPAIVRVFDVGQTADGDPFIVMELLEGQSLGAYLAQQRRLSAAEAVQLLLPIADALRVAHAKGIVHRDIKPDNVYLVREETGVQPKLLDFGIAKLGPREVAESAIVTFGAKEVDSKLTQRGAIVGSPDYMAPEQARGEADIDRRADIWAFCVVLYEMMSGQAPFTGATNHALLSAIMVANPTPLKSLLAADAELSQIVETGLEKDRQRRFQSMQELGEALARWLLKQGVMEDASGGSVEAKWVVRRGDSGSRQSRVSMGSIPDTIGTIPGLGRPGSSATEMRRVGEAPTSVGPVVTGANQRRPRRLLLPLGLALLVAVGFALSYFGSGAPHVEPKVAAPVAAVPSALPPPAAPPLVEPTAARATAEVAAPVATASVSPPATKSSRSRSPRPAPAKEAAKPAVKQGNDLLAPY